MSEYVPADRIVALVDRWRAAGGQIQAIGDSLARGANRMRTQDWVTLDFADKLLVEIGRTDAWHGELADVYQNPVTGITRGRRLCVTCSRCGSPLNEFTPGCATCQSRKGSQVRRDRDKRGSLSRSLPAGASARTKEAGATTLSTTAGGNTP